MTLDNQFGTGGTLADTRDTCANLATRDFFRITQGGAFTQFRCGDGAPTSLPNAANNGQPIMAFLVANNDGAFGNGFRLLACQQNCPQPIVSGRDADIQLGLGQCVTVQTSTWASQQPYPGGEKFTVTVTPPGADDVAFTPELCDVGTMTVQFAEGFDTESGQDTVTINGDTDGTPFSGPGDGENLPGTNSIEVTITAPTPLTLVFDSLTGFNNTENLGFSAIICTKCDGLNGLV